MSELIGYAIPVWLDKKSTRLRDIPGLPVPDRWDHTYVISSEGDSWGCFGGSQGGQEICRGKGDIAAAVCLAGDGQAGLVYGLQGVCHQIANRILWPARIRVTKATGYTFFSFIYGDYGRSEWHERRKCLGDQDDMPAFQEKPNGLQEPAAARFRFDDAQFPTEYGRFGDLDESPIAPPMSSGPLKNYSDDGRVRAFKEAIDERLGAELDREKRKRLLARQVESLPFQDDLVLAFERKEISAEAYFQAFSKLHRECLEDFDRILGRQDFIRLFDVPLENAPPPADPEAFARAHGLLKPPKVPD